ncbi:MAG TPA: ABC transporter permease [Bacteroidales bacterium]|jgi:putative ABC transport system permease protein|nr:ABC transporter permease [Bacteroidales bacterium]HNX84870.1 ABC transporter permease [Bacteroidales bacterium]HOC48087.1 ABC transporter permease [Bacteroidales bacterium]
MIRNLIKTAVRHILKHPGYSFLNVLGLTLGITSALFLLIYVSDEVSYDRYHEKADRIYRVSSRITETDDQFTWIVAQIPFGPQVAQDYPEVEAYVRFFNMPRALYEYEDKEFVEEDFFYADSALFDIFTYRVIRGDARRALLEPNKIVLTETVAARYFGDGDPVGRTLTSGNSAYEVTGVIEDVPSNSHFRFGALASRTNLPEQIGSWGNFGVFTYLLFPEGLDVKAFEEKMQGMYAAYMEPIFGPVNVKVEYLLEPIREIHLYSTKEGEPEPTGSITYVYIFAIVAIFLVLIAAMNYMNLSTARSSGRAREVGLRKVVGSRRGPLVLQFLSESVIFTVLSLAISIILLMALLPKLNLLAGKSFDSNVIFSPVVLLGMLGVVLLVGFIGGSYPAFFLSRFSPVTVLKGELTHGTAGSLFRKILVVIQFAVSVIMIVCTLVVFRQLNYLKNMDQGFDQKNVLSLDLNGPMAMKYPVLKQALLENPNVLYVSSTSTRLGEGSGKLLFDVETDQGMVQRGINFAIADHDFVEALGIKMVQGRDFQKDMPSDTLTGVIVNETFVRRMGWDEPIGKKVEAGDENTLRARVVGVMKDYHQTGMYNEIESLLLAYRTLNNIVYIKVSDENVEQALSHIESSWKEVFPDQPYSYTFLSERFNRQFESDEKRGLIFTLFTVLAILIACLGLFGLASYTVEQRTREIGIRKVFGANEGTILKLVTRDFIILSLISIVIAFPVAWYFMSKWLENYVYKSSMGPVVFILAGVLTLVITFATISYKAYQASVSNPAEAISTV